MAPAPVDTSSVIPPEPQPEKPSDKNLGLQEPFPPQTRIVFDDLYREQPAETTSVFLDSSQYLTPYGTYKIHKYKSKYSPDIVFASAAYSTFFGLQAMGLLAFSDMLGNNQIYLGLDLYSSLENSNVELLYLYLPKRTDMGIGIHHNVYFFAVRDSNYNLYPDGYHYFRDRNYGMNVFTTYPFSRYTRLEGSVEFMAIDRDNYNIVNDQYLHEAKTRVVMAGLSYVRDTILWGSVGPVNGARGKLSGYVSPDIEKVVGSPANAGWGLDFQVITADYRRYIKLGREYIFALRGTAGISTGKNPLQFFLGGENNWINRRYNGEIRSNLPGHLSSPTSSPPSEAGITMKRAAIAMD